MRILGVIPARGGSKRLLRKNIADLGGKPLLAWTVEAARKSDVLAKLIVSSEDDEILSVARKLSVATVVRPAELATDEATSVSVLQHAIAEVHELFDFVVLLQPTSPFRSASDIVCGVAHLKGGYYPLVSATEGGWKPNGAFYGAKPSWVLKGTLYDRRSPRFYMPTERSIDIDTAEDLERARAMLVNA